MTGRHTAVLAALALAVGLVPMSGTAAPAASSTVTISGTAYEFNSVHTMLEGATVRILEEPDLSATVAADGTYSIEVPDQARITPYLAADGYGTTHLQTFTTDGEDLTNVNIQTPTTEVMGLLAMVLGIETNDAGYPEQCAVVSTVSTKQVRGVTYDQFIDWGAHGVGGVTAHITPDAGTRTYFNEYVIPDASKTSTSVDGGVVWTGLPPGTYTLSAEGAGSAWPEVEVTCADGRIVNANPPWGLHQLATTVPTKVTPTWQSRRTAAPKLTGLRVAKLPTQTLPEQAVELGETIDFRGLITLSCDGQGCFAPRSTVGSMKKPVDLMPLLGRAAKKLRPGQTLAVTLAVPGYNTRVDSWRIGSRRVKSLGSRCIPLGESGLHRTC